jgi:hypothetical protein
MPQIDDWKIPIFLALSAAHDGRPDKQAILTDQVSDGRRIVSWLGVFEAAQAPAI